MNLNNLKKLITVAFTFFTIDNAQGQASFYLSDSIHQYSALSVNCNFADDAIYLLYNFNVVTKTDYNGHLIWSKQIPIQRMSIRDNFIYGVDSTGQKVLKLDTAGNIVWIKSFSANVINAPYPNSISDVICDGSRVFVFINQFQWQGIDHYYSIITLDTAGSVLNVISNTIGASLDYFRTGAPSYRKGAWISMNHECCISKPCNVIRIDSSGFFDTTASTVLYNYSNNDNVKNIIPLPDSNYLILENTSFYDPKPMPFILTKITENGTVLWNNSYNSHLTWQQYSYSSVSYAAADSLNNIYLLGNSLMDSLSGIFAMKIDGSGKIQFTKSWKMPWKNLSFDNPYSTIASNGMHYLHGKLYCFVNYHVTSKYTRPGILVFDTLFNNSCLGADTIVPFFQSVPFGGGSIPWGYAYPNTYTPVDSIGVSKTRTIPASLDICTGVYTNDLLKAPSFQIYPNPTTEGEFTIQNSHTMDGIRIYNTLGEKVYDKMVHCSSCVAHHQLPAGIYFVQVRDGERVWTQKVVVE